MKKSENVAFSCMGELEVKYKKRSTKRKKLIKGERTSRVTKKKEVDKK